MTLLTRTCSRWRTGFVAELTEAAEQDKDYTIVAFDAVHRHVNGASPAAAFMDFWRVV